MAFSTAKDTHMFFLYASFLFQEKMNTGHLAAAKQEHQAQQQLQHQLNKLNKSNNYQGLPQATLDLSSGGNSAHNIMGAKGLDLSTLV